MLYLKCKGQVMSVDVDERIADQYINANTVHFEFCERWNGMTITAQFTQDGKTYNKLVDEVTSTVILPNEIMAGKVEISAFGVHPVTGVRITTIPVKKTIDKSGFVGDGELSIPPTPDLYAQLLEKVNKTAIPHIGANGNWWFDDWDSGVAATAEVDAARQAAVNEINRAAANQMVEMDNKFNNTMKDIPETYTELDATVKSLKDTTADLEKEVLNANDVTVEKDYGIYADPPVEGSKYFSFGGYNSAPNNNYCTVHFEIKDGCTYKIRPRNHNRFYLGLRTVAISADSVMAYDVVRDNEIKEYEFTYNIADYPESYRYCYIYLFNKGNSELTAENVECDVLEYVKGNHDDSLYVIDDSNETVTPLVASFGSVTNGVPTVLVFEKNCLTFSFDTEPLSEYTISLKNNNRFAVGYYSGQLAESGNRIIHGVTNCIGMDSYTLKTNERRTYYVYATNDTTQYTPEISVVKKEFVTSLVETQKNEILKLEKLHIPSIGSPCIYRSEKTADSFESINSYTVENLYAVYDDLAARFPNVIRRKDDIGIDSAGNAIRAYEISLNNPKVLEGEATLSGVMNESLPNLWKPEYGNRTILVNAGTHGNEKVSCYGTALAIKELVESSEDWALYLKSNFAIKIIPCLNPYGYNNNVRANANGADINRDFMAFAQVETQAWKTWFEANKDNATCYLDVHGTSGYYAYWEVYANGPLLGDYANMCAKFTAAIWQDWESKIGLGKYPYCFTCKSIYNATSMQYVNEQGLPNVTLETPQDMSHPNGGWDNDLRSCKVTKDMLINAMQMFGSYFN